MPDKRILLIGGNGFIGSALASRLVGNGCQVGIISRSPVRHDFPEIRWHQGNLLDGDFLKQSLAGYDTVFYLASETTPGSSAQQPLLESPNLAAILAVLGGLADFPDCRLMFFSSGGTVYGNSATLPASEDAPLDPLSFHGAGKVAQEAFLRVFQSQGRNVVILRPSNAYGPGQPKRPGFGFIRTVLERLWRDEVIEILGDGSTLRDFIHVSDVASACTFLIEHGPPSGIFNVGSGIGIRLIEIIQLAKRITGLTPRISWRPSRGTDVRAIVLDISRLGALGWQPEIGLEAGIEETWQWIKEMQ